MKQTKRYNIFETNSSSTHCLTLKTYEDKEYLPKSDKIIVNFIDTDEEIVLTSLRDKVSYLVSQIINNYKWDVQNYHDLKEQIEKNYDFIRIKNYVEDKFNKKVILPDKYDIEDDDIEDIVNINHQLHAYNLDELLDDLVKYNHDPLDDVLAPDKSIKFGHD